MGILFIHVFKEFGFRLGLDILTVRVFFSPTLCHSSGSLRGVSGTLMDARYVSVMIARIRTVARLST